MSHCLALSVAAPAVSTRRVGGGLRGVKRGGGGRVVLWEGKSVGRERGTKEGREGGREGGIIRKVDILPAFLHAWGGVGGGGEGGPTPTAGSAVPRLRGLSRGPAFAVK